MEMKILTPTYVKATSFICIRAAVGYGGYGYVYKKINCVVLLCTGRPLKLVFN